ncbi:hypothetical protein DICVIV_02626 [Dictyocaulus viviparus]|uniref:Uncharacterized protein n=1 Tax=Dictyocaulus viviparus TaxID=29172 RepID=A0A0D8Y9A1_DICVI|nr:hypothetical protein DICVIV_02626 [Dictyocaulus viviparus]
MARSVSRARKAGSKSPARVKRQITSPKSEPKRMVSPITYLRSRSITRKFETPRISSPKAHTRSRSSSKGRKIKKGKASPGKSISRSKSHGRKMAIMNAKDPKISPKMSSKTLEKAEEELSLKTSAVKPRTFRSDPTKISYDKASAMDPTSNTKNVFTSTDRVPRLPERKIITSSYFQPEFRQRYIRNESSDRSPPKVTLRKPATSSCSSLYKRVVGTVSAVGGCVCDATCAACNKIVVNRREIFVTFALLLLVALMIYLILYTDPAKTRAFIHSIPERAHAFYQKHVSRRK